MQAYMGGNPPRRNPVSKPKRPKAGGGMPFGWSQGNAWWKQAGGKPPGLGGASKGGGRQGGGYGPGGGGGFNFNPNRGPRGGGGANPGGGQGGGQGNGQGGGSPFDPGNLDAILNGTGDYAQLMKKLGMPLDPQFLAQRTSLVNQRDSGLSQLLNQLNVGNAQLDQTSLLGNRAIDENVAARGLFGSGIERRNERLLGNDVAQQRLGLQTGYQQGQLGTQQDYRSQMMQALVDLASRLQGQSNLPLPTWGPWAMGGK